MSFKLPEDHEFVVPRRAVLSMEDMQLWEKSEAYLEYLGFIMTLNEAVKGKSLSVECPVSDITKGVVALLDTLEQWLNETPPIVQPQRFGNQAFRTWYAKLKEGAIVVLERALPEEFHKAIPEIMVYLTEGFGNSTRIDYGTGHEMCFLMFMCCLFKIGALKEGDKIAAGVRNEDFGVNPERAREEAEQLYAAGELQLGTDEAVFNKIMAHESFPQLKYIFEEYKNVSGRTIEQALNAELSGELLEAMLAIVENVQHPPTFFAKRLHAAMNGLGTDDTTLIRIIVSRCEYDLGNIKEEFERLYDKTLESAVKSETSGDYKRALVALIGGP